MAGSGADRVLLGRVHGLFGVRGWVKVYSYTIPVANILNYSLWQIGRHGEWRPMRLVDGRAHGKGLVAHLAPADGEPLADRDAAAALLGSEIAVARADLPPPAPGEYYWADLVGLRVINREGTELGTVADMMDNGAHGILVVAGERERLIPFVTGPIVDGVDFQAGTIAVDWQPDW